MELETILTNNCPNCNKNDFINYEENIICNNCGLIIEENNNITQQSQRAFTYEEIKNRKINEPRWRPYGNRTLFNPWESDAQGHQLSYKQKKLYSRLSMIQRTLINSLEHNLWKSRPLFNKIKKDYCIPDYIIDTAMKIYKKCAEKRLTKGRSITQFVTASIYTSMRVNKYPYFLQDYAKDLGQYTNEKLINNARIIMKKPGSNILKELKLIEYPEEIPWDSIRTKFDMTTQDAINIKKYYNKIKNKINGQDPKGVLAGIIYEYYNDRAKSKKTQNEIAEKIGITEVTLRKHARTALKYM